MSEDQSIVVIAIIAGAAVGVAILYYLNRWIFSIERQLWNQKAQITLLIRIAEKLGVSRDEIDIIEEHNKQP